MKTVVALIILFIVTYVKAEPEQLRVMILDDNIKKSDFPQNVKFDSRKKKMSFTREDRDTQFEKIKLSIHTTKMDELGRDLLFMDLKSKSIEELTVLYPQIPSKDLEYAKTNFSR